MPFLGVTDKKIKISGFSEKIKGSLVSRIATMLIFMKGIPVSVDKSGKLMNIPLTYPKLFKV
jgi:hypothetical protein